MAKQKKSKETATRKFAAVTGASSGIGYELAKEFALNGFDLMIVAEDERIHEVADELQTSAVTVKAVQTDLASRKGVRTFYDAVKNEGRPLDAIALNAGVGVGGPFVENDLDEEIKMINLNVTSVVHLAKLVLEDMVERGEGKVLFTSSLAATTPGPYMAIYHATKAFIQSFCSGVREELKESGVTLTALMPGATETEFFKRAHLEDTKIGASEKDSATHVAKQGFEAMMAGKDHVVGGSWKNSIEVFTSKFVPEGIKAAQAAKGAEPGSADETH